LAPRPYGAQGAQEVTAVDSSRGGGEDALDLRLQQYLDGTLPRREAVELFLQAERDPRLRARLEAWRALLSQLDALPRVAPSATFDAKILASVPYAHYRSLPRRPQPALVVGDPDSAPAALARMLRPLRSWGAASAVAYVLFLVLSHSWLARGARVAAEGVGDRLAELATRSRDVPVLSGILTAIHRIYEIGTGAVAALSGAVGGAAVTLALGLVVGLVVGLIVHGSRRRVHAQRFPG
jgi:hypothetical protein